MDAVELILLYLKENINLIRLFIVDRAQIMCDTMTRVMAEEPDIQVIGSGTSIAEALARLNECDLVLVSADLPGVEVLKLIEGVARKHPTTKVVVMDWSDSQDALRQYVAAGLAAYVLEDESVEDMLETMRAVHESNRVADLTYH